MTTLHCRVETARDLGCADRERPDPLPLRSVKGPLTDDSAALLAAVAPDPISAGAK